MSLERSASDLVNRTAIDIADRIKADYDMASLLFPFWENYPPEERGRAPIGDQFPWIEVGEHSVGGNLARAIANSVESREIGFPTGADQRLLLVSPLFSEVSNDAFDRVWLLLDIKSVGPRDDQAHAVMSHNQITGSGEWDYMEQGVTNSTMIATGSRASHDFYPSIPPLIVDDLMKPAPTVTMAVKPVYSMESKSNDLSGWVGQPLRRLDLIVIPNGILLDVNPNYLGTHPHLLFPGKDDKSKDPRKLRARVSFEVLSRIGSWRYRTLARWD